MNEAPAAFRRSLRNYLANSAESLPSVGLRFAASPFGPCANFVYRKSLTDAGVIATHIDDISGRGEPDLLSKVQGFSEKRFRKLEVQEGSIVHVGMGLAQEKDSSATLIQADFARNLELLPTPPALWAGPEEHSSTEYIKSRQCKLGELRRVATVSRPDIYARQARTASRIDESYK